MPQQSASSPPQPSLLTALRAPAGPIALAVAGAVAVAALPLLIAEPVASTGPTASHIFEYLFDRNEPAAAWLALAVLVLALLSSRWPTLPERFIVSRLARDPRAFITGATVVLAAAALLVYRAHPLSMDEYAPFFQARIFARGRLHAQVPPELIPRLVPPFRWFIEASPSGAMVSTYWPGFALLLTPFVWVGCPWLLNPLLGGAALVLVWRVGRLLWPDGAAAGWAVLFTAASPAFSLNAISYYSMNAHLAASLAFALLVLEGRLFLAGVIGSVALSLHNPFPHTLFALPWMAWLGWAPGRARKLLRLGMGYVPGVAILVLGWMWYRAWVIHPVHATQEAVSILEAIAQSAFAAPSSQVVLDRAMNLAELASWAVPLLPLLAILGAARFRAMIEVRLLSASALLTLAAYSFVTFNQGHGWGFRYFHPVWFVLPLLAAGALESVDATAQLRKLALAAALCSLALCTPLRFGQVRTFIGSHLAQVPPAGGGRQVIFLDVARGSYTIDLVQNDPFLEGNRWILISLGAAEDSRWMAMAFPRARRTAVWRLGSVWQVD